MVLYPYITPTKLRNASFWPASPSARAAPMAMEKARWAESALAQCEERGEAANARALLETSLAKYVEAFVTAKLTRDDRAIHPDILAADYERVGQLIDDGADVDAKAAGWAPIHLAVYHDDPRLLALLIARGADINLPATRRSYTPLIYAAIAGNLNATEQLLNARADPRSLHRQVQDGARLRAQVPPRPARSALRLRRPRPGPGRDEEYARQAGQNRRSSRRQDRAPAPLDPAARPRTPRRPARDRAQAIERGRRGTAPSDRIAFFGGAERVRHQRAATIPAQAD